MNGHSIIPPSSAGIWGKPDGCTGWVIMNQQYPDSVASEDAADGIAAHEIAATMLKDAARTGQILPDTFTGNVATNGVIYTREMYDGAVMYVEDVLSIMRSSAVFTPVIEQHIQIPAIHEQSHGTPDNWLFDKRNMTLYIWDFKFGISTVEAFENWQMINYIAGIVDQLNVNGVTDQLITVNIRVVQPRAYHADSSIRQWVVKLSVLRAHFNILRTNAAIALSDKAQFHTGSHCKDCNGRHACPAALQAGLQLYEVATQPIAQELPVDALGLQLSIVQRALKQLEYIESGLSEQIEHMIRSGKFVPGWAMQPKHGREKWNKPVAEVLTMGQMMGHDLRKPDDAITPNQARKLGIDDAVISAYTIKPSSVKLVRDDGTKAKRIFSNER